ncbi:MAG: hypothetical protein A2836_02055 [Candidatus Taylorbacteria bacterium RIFCSPHIGHO2_01_FULL_45_63]|uniref:Glycosyl transferase family 1 domain-containing protein n=1 Tax=Candidatus Taylorbacteria bacterium RIFCSPHIGHO2_02_FULL_45_35 TaxID=1802311 RepID=A0A1G2MWD1_9BACT|nr:MAG: hypothetical protein A2836_02055 [Candidatus Taylorbacteria bacterium RIFCSPHIGHO2_01_FULL_45_63]OHA27392.1 MAG: hypothetical protein A3D56_03820 [Candidatus Taylorbacteria bacterium RIFCSPHIGHO2_02_FULL_45_35]OHA34255.1 MAG: hypothetical protein A3A22_01210 [Candidatus Taylorbacteria bacterium RIFCSPLOWO2_01_FULL_45_34b]
MKLFYIANARMPSERAHAIQIAKMSEAFILSGTPLQLVVPKRKTLSSSIRDFYKLKADVPLIRLPVLDIYGGNRGRFWLGSFSFMLSYFFTMWVRYLRGERGVVYTIDMDQFSIFLVAFLPFRFFIEIHDAKPRGFVFFVVFKRARGIITINNIIKEKLCERFHLPPEKILVHPNGIDIDFFDLAPQKKEAREKLGLSLQKKTVVYTGQFYDWKGLDIFPAAAKQLPEIYFYLVGGSREEFSELTGISDIPENVIFAGKRPYEEMPLWLKAADALVVLGTKQNEYSYYHTSPMKLFEYLASGGVIVAAATPAIKDVVSEKEVFFYEPDNVDSFAVTIKQALSEDTHSKQAFAKEAAHRFTWQKRALSILGFIKGLV